MVKTIMIYLIEFYQKYLTILSFGSCRYYPTCSNYAKIQFEHNSFFKALTLSILRILRCNKFFRGGFDYVHTKCPTKTRTFGLLNKDFKQIKIKYWKIPKDGHCIVIQYQK